MIKTDNESLKSHTSVKIGGIAENYYMPESVEELCGLTKKLQEEELYIISGGSNLLINDEKTFKNVISMAKTDDKIIFNEDSSVYVGASVRIQQLINSAKEKELGGIEFLYSLPAMLGGIITMNAGRGDKFNLSISNFVQEVYAVKDGEKFTFSKEECNFSYRHSIFQNSRYIVTGAKLLLENSPKDEIQKRIQERIDLCKRDQDNDKPTFGSVFSKSNAKIMGFIRKFDRRKGGIVWSPKRKNQMINDGTGTFKQAAKRISACKKIHKLFGKKIETEVVIWN